MRAFSTIEILIALAIATTSIVGSALIAFGTPAMLQDARLEYTAFGLADSILTGAELSARKDFDSINPIATTSDSAYAHWLSVGYLEDGLAARLIAYVSWTDTHGRRKEVALDSIITDPQAARDQPCSPVVVGNWREPHISANYTLSGDNLLPGISGTYPVSDIAATHDRLIVAVSSTNQPTDPTLFLFSLGGANDRPLPMSTFDNASTSRSGLAAVTAGGGNAYAASGFGSGSQATCSSGACAQLLVFDPEQDLVPVGRLTLPTTAPPYASSAGNSTTPAKSIAYRNGFIYLGLEKTVNGDEFNIIDVHDPKKPIWVSGIPVGRSVNDISIQGGYAYLATSDSARELLVIDIHDPANPHIISEWNAPGATNFGLGNVVVARPVRTYFGRSYVGNASEFFAFDMSDLLQPRPTYENDTGTIFRPESTQGIIVRDFLVAVLSGKRLEFWNSSGDQFERYADTINLPGTGTSLACRGNMLYVGTVDSTGAGFLSLVTAS